MLLSPSPLSCYFLQEKKKKITLTSFYFSIGFQPEILINSAGLSNQPNAEEVQPLFWEGSVTVVTLPDPLFFKLACAPHPMGM